VQRKLPDRSRPITDDSRRRRDDSRLGAVCGTEKCVYFEIVRVDAGGGVDERGAGPCGGPGCRVVLGIVVGRCRGMSAT
jgi:hypothetical protein